MKNSFLPYIIVYIICMGASLAASASNYLFSTISLDDGLSNPNVKCVLRDSRDYLWIGTKGGLNRYDHGKMRIYRRNPAIDNTLPDNDINSIFEDERGNIWVICTSGVVTYNRDKDLFSPATYGGHPLRARSHALVPSGIIFGGAGAIFFYDYNTGEISQRPSSGGSSMYYTAIRHWTRDRFLLATRWDGLYVYNAKSGEVRPLQGFDGKRISASLIDNDATLWIAVYGEGLFKIDNTGRLTRPEISGLNRQSIILDILEYGDNLWIATDGEGIIVYDKFSGQGSRADAGTDHPGALKSANCLYRDRYDYIYAGTVRGGLTCIYSSPLKTFGRVSDLETFTVTSLLTEGDRIWMGIDGEGIMLYEPEREDLMTIQPSTKGMKIVSLDNFDDRHLLVSTFDNGLSLFDTRNGSLSPAPEWASKVRDNNRGKGLSLDLKRLPGNRMALVTDRVYICDLNGTNPETYSPEDNSGRLRFLHSDIDHIFCYSEHELLSIDLMEKRMTSLCKIDRNSIECAAYDGNRYIYAGTPSGLIRYDFETGDTEPFGNRVPQGAAVTAVTCHDGKLWISVLGKMYLMDPETGDVREFGVLDGVQPNEFIYKAVASTPRLLLMGGVNGLLKIDLQDLPTLNVRTQRTPVRLCEVLADGLPVASEDNLIRLPENYSTVKLRFDGGPTHPMETDPVRIYIGRSNLDSPIETSDNTLTLGHMQASQGGRFDIYASTRGANGQWSDPEHVGAIMVPMAWWRKTWVLILIGCVAAVAIILAAFYIHNTRKQRKSKTIEEQKRQSLEREVGFLMNLNYDLRTPLTLIYSRLKLLSESLSHQNMPRERMLEELDNIYRNTGKMRDIINTTVDLWRSGDMKTGEKLEPISVAPWIRETVNEFRQEINEKKIQLNMENLDEKLSMICDLRRATVLMHNVMRTTLSHEADRTPLTIEASPLEDRVRILITFYNDTSHGAGEEFRYAGHLMALMDGELIYTRHENGLPSTIRIDFPKELKRQAPDSGNLPGTRLKPGSIQESNKTDATETEATGFDLSRLTVIVVEDDPELRELLVTTLGRDFKRVIEASNGKDALTLIKNSNPDLIITEARLPEMSGLELCRTIKKTKEYSHIPVIMLTTRLEEMSIANGNNYGADNYLTKPFDIGVLENRCVSVLKSFDRVKQWYRSQASDILPADSRHSNDAETFVFKVREIIKENIGDPDFSIESIMEKMFVSRTTLQGKFKEVTGQTLGSYISDYKINLAKDMILKSDMTMNEIADALGFNSQRYFSTFFKEKTGVSPSTYRASKEERLKMKDER